MPRQKKQRLKRRKDGRYCAVYKGKQFMGRTEEEALALRDEYKAAEKRGDFVPSSCPTLAEYAVKWLPMAKPGASASTMQESKILLAKLLDACGNTEIRDILPSDIKAVYSTRFKGLSDSYIRGAKQLYIALFDAASADGYCRRNPAQEKAAQPHKGTKGGHRAITPQERQWINTLCLTHRCRPAVMAMLYEGLRPPEAKAFNIDRSVDWDAGVIRLVDFAHKGRNNHYEITSQGKTKKAAREIPLFSPFAETIKGKSGPLIPTARGGELTMQAWRVVWQSYVHQMEQEINGMEKRWYRRTKAHKAILAEADRLRKEGKSEEAAKKEAEIPPWVPFTVRPYDLRHSFATYCRDMKPPIEINTVIEWMGHADATMILKIYDEVSSDRSKSEGERLEKALLNMQNHMQTRTYRVKRSNIKRFKP